MTTPPPAGPQKTGQQLRTETITAMNAAITASGLPDGWGNSWTPGARQWDPDTREFIGASCSVGSGDRKRFELHQAHLPVGDPVAFAHKMGDYWKTQGYAVSTVAQAGGLIDIRVDREDGSLYGGVAASDTVFTLDSFSECSTDPTLSMFAGPTGYRAFDDEDPNPYHPTKSPSVTPYPLPGRSADVHTHPDARSSMVHGEDDFAW
ncbi:hypothetical protein AB4Z18_10540 [Leifsonia sp. 2TAF2]|uniref:hypothetical protein n=1 Tax=Leifsonia sp. 2TAF2 TaxID=3233009 RepID=UPI003F966D9E